MTFDLEDLNVLFVIGDDGALVDGGDGGWGR